MGTFRGRGPLWAAAIVCAIQAAGCSGQPPPRAEVVRPVKTTLVVAGGGTQVRSFPGKVEASKQAELAFQVSGVITELPVTEGKRVAAGELIAQLRLTEFEARLQTLQGQLAQSRALLRRLERGERPEEILRREAQLRSATARLENARIEHERNERLLRTSSIARATYDLSETAYRVAQEDYQAAVQLLEKGTIGREEDIEAQQAEIRSLEGRVVEAQLQLSDATLRAPFDGVIARRFVEANQNIRAKEPVVQFQDVNEIDVVVDVPETVMAADLRTADMIRLAAEFSGAPGLEFPVRIKEVAQVADPTTQTFAVRVGLAAPPDLRILPGMTATVTLTYRRASVLGSQIMVPVAAVTQTDDGQQVAWIVGPDHTVSRRAVQVGSAVGGTIEILKGLAPGDRIAVAGVAFLREGMRVRDLGDSLGAAGGGL